jgi:glyoxylase-like metal-dependent hydrolase (beta-lactamase superfamily II)
MKRFFFCVVMLVTTCCFAQHGKLDIQHLAGNYYVFTTYKHLDGVRIPSNGLYVVTRAGVIVVDSPWDTTQCGPLLDSIERRHHTKIVLCIATHFHDDRTAALEFFRNQGIPTYASKLTRELCRKNREKEPEFWFASDTTFRIGSVSINTYFPGAGHSPDNIVLWFEDAAILYGGCLVKSTENHGLGYLTDADPEAWAGSIQRVIDRYPNPKYVIPGHFGWDSTRSLEHTLGLLRQHRK